MRKHPRLMSMMLGLCGAAAGDSRSFSLMMLDSAGCLVVTAMAFAHDDARLGRRFGWQRRQLMRNVTWLQVSAASADAHDARLGRRFGC